MKGATDSRAGRGFDRLAPVYDLLLALGSWNSIPRIRRSLLHEVPSREHALVLGDGSGVFLCELMATGRVRRVTCIDISPAMVAKASRRWRIHSRRLALAPESVEFRVAALPLPPPEDPGGPYDLVCTNFFLDLFTDTELKPVFRQIHASLGSGGIWYDSDFHYPDPSRHRFLNLASRLLVRVLYCFFRIVCGLRADRLPNTKQPFETHGYELRHEAYAGRGLLICRIFQKM